MHSGFSLHVDEVWKIFEVSRRTRARQQWVRYVSNWPIVLNALRQLWETGKVSELKSPFWEPPQKTENK
jgi:hypothetical protein